MTARILVIGAESSGKTTFCEALGKAIDMPVLPEYGRAFGEITGNVYEFKDMLRIAEAQVQLEELSSKFASPVLICDTSPLVTEFYSQRWYGKVDPKLEKLARRTYDLVFFCARDFDYVDDGSRNGEEFGMEQQQYYVDHLRQPYIMLFGPVEERVKYAVKHLQWSGFLKAPPVVRLFEGVK